MCVGGGVAARTGLPPFGVIPLLAAGRSGRLHDSSAGNSEQLRAPTGDLDVEIPTVTPRACPNTGVSNASILGLTATATGPACDEICRALGLRRSVHPGTTP